jgi:hypothetical protein
MQHTIYHPVRETRMTRYPISSVCEQGCGTFNEDHLLLGTQTFGVFDGSSSLTTDLFENKTGAWWASFLARSAFFQEDIPLAQAIPLANKNIQQGMENSGVDVTKKVHRWSTSAAIFRVHNDRLEWVQTGDSLVGVIHDDGQAELVSPYTNHDRETLGLMREYAARGVEDIRTAALPKIMQIRERMNEDYGVLNGEDAALDFIASGSMPTRGIKHVIAFTDGMFPPSQELRNTFDFSTFAKRFQDQGLQGILEEIRAEEEADPHCHIYPRFKRHDDATAVALSLG